MKTKQKILKLLDLLKENGVGYEGIRRPHSMDLCVFQGCTVFNLMVRGDTLTIETHSTEEALKSLLDTLKIKAKIEDMAALRRAVISLKQILKRAV